MYHKPLAPSWTPFKSAAVAGREIAQVATDLADAFIYFAVWFIPVGLLLCCFSQLGCFGALRKINANLEEVAKAAPDANV